MKVLVTGGSGFIGSAVCRHLVASGDEVVNLDNMTYAATRGSTAMLEGVDRYAFERADIGDAAAVARLFARHRPDGVMNLAAETHVDRSITGSAAFLAANVMGAHTLLEAALHYWRGLPKAQAAAFRFLHVSTDEVYGALGDTGLFDEHSPYDPRSPYAASKAASDHLVAAWGHTYGLPVLISNCSNNYGPFHFPEKLIPLTIVKALAGEPLPVYGDGLQVRDWLFVEDHAEALRLILTRGRPGERYNVGGRNERHNLEVVQAICDELDRLARPPATGPRRRLITFVTDRPGHDRRYAIDAAKLERELGWRAAHGFDAGLRQTVRWYLDNAWWWRPLRANYAGERLGLVTSPGGLT